MDLVAYCQIDDLDKIAEDNGIEVPRLRGYRLMKDEEPVSKEDIEKMCEQAAIDTAVHLCGKYWNPNEWCVMYSYETELDMDYYLTCDVDENGWHEYTGIRWDRIHGKKRRILKFEIKKAKRKVMKQYELWNKYAGKDSVLYIHSRIGGRNWKYFGGEKLKQEPWFLDHADDWWDGTYCDIYAKIDVKE